MVKYIVSGLILACLIACSMSGKLSRKYEGKRIESLYRDLGEPKNMVTLENGNRIFIYEKEVYVKETVIGTGRMNLDPRVSPSFLRVEISRFEIDKNGIIVQAVFSKRVER